MANELNQHDSYVTETGLKAPKSSAKPSSVLWKILKPLASLQLTVTLLALSIILVFYGTIAQKTNSTWTVVDDYFRSAIVFIPNQLTAEFLSTFFEDFVGKNPQWPGRIPFPGGWTLGTLMLVNLLAAHILRFKLTWKRSGLITVHFGLILLLLSELVTGLCAVESHMILSTGERSNFLNIARQYELAFTKEGDAKYDEAITVPHKMLKPDAKISDPELPVDIVVDEYWSNSELSPILPESLTKETVFIVAEPETGETKEHKIRESDQFITLLDGKKYILMQAPIVTGVDAGEKENEPCVKVRFYKKGTTELIGTYHFTVYQFFFSIRQDDLFPKVTVKNGDDTYSVMLRNRRVYKPYSLELVKFEHKVYPGTRIPRDFASTVNLDDPERGYKRDNIRIWMNNPLRYRDESFFQHQSMGDGRGTVLMVMENPGRILPYLSCFLVTLGLIVHFVISYNARSRNRMALAVSTEIPEPIRWTLYSAIPWVVAILGLFWLGSKYDELHTESDDPIYKQIARIPIMEEGRVMPLDSFARSHLQSISNRTEVFKWDEEKHKAVFSKSAVEWLLDMMDPNLRPTSRMMDEQIFRIDNDQLLGQLELKPRPGFYRYSISDLDKGFEKFDKQAKEAFKKAPKERDIFDDKVLQLRSKIEMFLSITQGMQPHIFPPTVIGQPWKSLREVNADAVNFVPTKEQRNAALIRAREQIAAFIKREYGGFDRVPEEKKAQIDGIEDQIVSAELEKDYLKTLPKVTQAIFGLLDAHKNERILSIREAVDTISDFYAEAPQLVNAQKISFESRLNFLSPLYYCSYLYLTSAILIMISLLFGRNKVLGDSAFYLTAATLAVHTVALITRMSIQGRPPVTNLYSAAIFIGWIAVGLSLIYHRVLKSEIPTLAGNFVGAATLFVANIYLTASGDTLGMLQAVLDTDFWLATHVTMVTIGYSITLFAGFLGLIYLVAGPTTGLLGAKQSKYLAGMVYGSVCLALLCSFLGTVLGGLWADYSWGRFWGWDPKENGAVLVVLWNALILHSRWCGLVKDRGMSILALSGIMFITWSYFGTNQLGIGLHAYGFDKGLANFCMYVWVTNLVLIGLALIPIRLSSEKA